MNNIGLRKQKKKKKITTAKNTFLLFLPFVTEKYIKTAKKMIVTSKRHAKHPSGGRNTQVYLVKTFWVPLLTFLVPATGLVDVIYECSDSDGPTKTVLSRCVQY